MRRYLLAGVGLLAGVAAVVVWWFVLSGRRPTGPAAPAPVVDLRRTYDGPYQNIAPSVRYVGDDACRECHIGEHTTYRDHPMGRSSVAIATLAPRQPYDSKHRNPFEAFGLRLEVLTRNGITHRVSVEDEDSLEFRFPVQVAVGSGSRGYSYLTESGGYVFQTPISWFSQKEIWDLSPGFSPAILCGRPVGVACLQCHVNRVKTIVGEPFRFEAGVFEGLSIGCERCHGPGEKHVAARKLGGNDNPRFDPTIVHPGKLPRRLRDAVCEQCHLQGESRFARRGLDWFDYRPGLPLEAFLSVHMKARSGADTHKAVNHVEQMRASKCWQASDEDKKLGCTSCHDPHKKPSATDRVTHFRTRCLTCHQQQGCAVAEATRRRDVPNDSCMECHMPRQPASDIAHTALTDHRIVRHKKGDGRPGSGLLGDAGDLPIANFYAHRLKDDPDAARDLGIALVELRQRGKLQGRLEEVFMERAASLLSTATTRASDDAAAWLALGEAQSVSRRPEEAIESLQKVLEHWPNSAQAHDRLAYLERARSNFHTAMQHWQRATEINPHDVNYRREVAPMLARAGRWPEAKTQTQAWLRIDPLSASARQLWILCLLQDGNRPEARRQMELLRKLRPSNLQQLEREFEMRLRE